jgi:anti-sigma B factor antagonist
MTIEIKTKEISGNEAIISISGRLTAATAQEVKNQIKSLISTSHINLILDLGKTVFIDSSGLSAFVSGLKQVRELGGSFKLACLQSDVLTLFRLTMLDRVFEMYPTLEQALIPMQKKN